MQKGEAKNKKQYSKFRSQEDADLDIEEEKVATEPNFRFGLVNEITDQKPRQVQKVVFGDENNQIMQSDIFNIAPGTKENIETPKMKKPDEDTFIEDFGDIILMDDD